MASTLGKVDKVALPPFEEHKLCQRTSHAQFQITLSTVALLPHTGEKSDYIERNSDLEKSQITLGTAALSYHTLEKSQITLRGSTATLRLI